MVSSSLAMLVDNFMTNITELRIQADLIEGRKNFNNYYQN